MTEEAIVESVMNRPSLMHLSKLSGTYFAKEEADPNFLRVTVRKSPDFFEETLKNVVVDAEEGVTAIVGIVKASKVKVDVSSFRFPVSKFDMQKASIWVAKHHSNS